MQQPNGDGRIPTLAQVRYVDSKRVGYCRKISSGEFCYFNTKGKQINDPRVLNRIQSLVIPPQWVKVWICPDAKGHIQATGVDRKGRKQYIYHREWKKLRKESKFERLLPFGERLARLRKHVSRDLRNPTMDLQKVCALVIEIMDLTSIRPGHDSYKRQNGSYGLTTLNKRHLHQQSRGTFLFRFTGKKGIRQEKKIKEKKISRLLQKVREIPGQRLFQYVDSDDKTHHLDSGQLNHYLRQHMGVEVSCKTFRTWNACVSTLNHLIQSFPDRLMDRENKIRLAIDEVSQELGNTPRVARQHYILPELLEKYQRAEMDRWLKKMQSVPKIKHEEYIRRYFLNILRTERICV